jgi:ankyrin repeat protein
VVCDAREITRTSKDIAVKARLTAVFLLASAVIAQAQECKVLCSEKWWKETEQSEILEVIISTNVDVQQEDGWSPLHYAAAFGNVETIEVLISAGADVNSMTTNGRTPLLWAVEFRTNEPNIIRTLISGGSNVNIHKDGWTPLFWVMAYGSSDSVQDLLEAGANIGVRDRHGYTALHWGAKGGSPRSLALLIHAGAAVMAHGENQRTPLHFAAGAKTDENIKVLLDFGADVMAQDEHGWTPLHSAAAFGTPDHIKILTKAGADVLARNEHGITPLHWAAYLGSHVNVEALLRADSDVNSRDNDGQTPLHFAAGFGSPKKIGTLLKAAAKLDAADNLGRTPLHAAAKFGTPENIEILLHADANRFATDHDGSTPFDLAKGNQKLKDTKSYWALTDARPTPTTNEYCLKECLKNNQARAVAWDQIERDCKRSCKIEAGTPLPELNSK